MPSIQENDDYHIEQLIARDDYEPSMSSQLLAPHWTPSGLLSGPATASGHHNRDYSHNLNESGYADNDSDSDDDINNLNSNSADIDGVTPPVSDADMPVSPYYEDTPLMDGKGNIIPGSNYPDLQIPNNVSPRMSPKNTLELRPQNSLNLGDALDAMEAQMMNNNSNNSNNNEEHNDIDNNNNASNTPIATRQSSLLRSIPENEDTEDDISSANDTDAATAYEHMRNLSTHLEDQEYHMITSDNNNQSGYDQEDSEDDHYTFIDNRSIIHGGRPKKIQNMRISIERNQSMTSSPGHTPPPVSPRYKKMTSAHKRKLSDKLDSFLNHRQNPQQLIQKRILYVTPEQDIESVKEKIQIKREEREKVKKRLKRKLSHDFRPSEQDIEDRGIKLVPDIIESDEEDNDEEIIVYDNTNDRASFSLQKKKSINKNIKRKKYNESSEFANILQKERKRNSKKIELALEQRPTPAQILETGYIQPETLNNIIPPNNKKDQIDRLNAELKLIMIQNRDYKIEKEQRILKQKRRNKILTFYDNYLFNYMFDDDDDDQYPLIENYVDIDSDYQTVLSIIQNEHKSRNKNNQLFSRKDVISKLYNVCEEEISLEKEWMRNLRKRKFRTYINKNKCKMLEIKKNKLSQKLNELNQQIQLIQNTQKVDKMTLEIKTLEEQRYIYIKNTSQQIDDLRDIIKNLNKIYSKKNSFISVSS